LGGTGACSIISSTTIASRIESGASLAATCQDAEDPQYSVLPDNLPCTSEHFAKIEIHVVSLSG
jgi:hypothetical protein